LQETAPVKAVDKNIGDVARQIRKELIPQTPVLVPPEPSPKKRR
jgi:hypothetical protein